MKLNEMFETAKKTALFAAYCWTIITCIWAFVQAIDDIASTVSIWIEEYVERKQAKRAIKQAAFDEAFKGTDLEK